MKFSSLVIEEADNPKSIFFADLIVSYILKLLFLDPSTILLIVTCPIPLGG